DRNDDGDVKTMRLLDGDGGFYLFEDEDEYSWGMGLS
nr:hypothetical protein [Tanacetum cinerariifolium]